MSKKSVKKRQVSGRQTLKADSGVIFVLGAGVDRALGLPLMNTLFHDLDTFATGPGKVVEKAIRKHVKHLRFNLSAYAGDQGEQLGQKLLGSHAHLLPTIQTALGKHPDQTNANLQAIKTVITKLGNIAQANELEEGTVTTLSAIAGEADGANADTLLDPQHIAFRPVTRQAIKRLFTTVPADIPALNADEQQAFSEVVAILSNFEEMLGEFFSGYFTKDPTNQKKYFYLSWLLWAYIREREEAGRDKRDHSFYRTLSEIGSGSGVITFNYTDFFCDKTKPSNGYFHGDCKAYLRFDKREYISDNHQANDAKTVDKMASFIEGLPVDWTKDVPEVYLPAFVPPLSVKPIICTEYLDRWYECGQIIKAAKTIIIIGYSFNVADEHFNDLIRKGNSRTKLLVINPTLEGVVNEVCRLISQDKANLTATTSDELECKSGGRVTFVSAKAQDIEGHQLLKLLRY